MKKCQYCAAEIPAEANVCRYCMRDQYKGLRRKRRLVGLVVLGVAILVVGTYSILARIQDLVEYGIYEARAEARAVAEEVAREVAADVARESGADVWREAARAESAWDAPPRRRTAVAAADLRDSRSLALGERTTVDIAADEIVGLRFDVAQGSYRIEANRAPGSDFDPFISLFDEELNFLGSNDDGGAGFNSRMDRQLEAGSYYLEVSELIGREGDCVVLVAASAGP